MRPGGFVIETYGQTENMGPVFMPVPGLPIGCCGNGKYSWHKIKEYYKNPEMTAKCFNEDGWYKTGDLLYKDERENYFFVERIQQMINGQACAHLIEKVVRSHPGVREVCVTTVRASDVEELPVACVVKKQGSNVTAQEIKELVADKLPESQKLRGGVVFMDKIPTTSVGKIALGKLNQIVFSARRE